MKRTHTTSLLTLLILAVNLFLFSTFLLPQKIVILPDADPLLNSLQVTRGELAEVVISYFPHALLVRLAGGIEIPDPKADPETVWEFLNSTRMIPAFSDGNNYPEDIVTRGQMALILQNIMRSFPFIPPKKDSSFKLPIDLDSSSYFAKPVRAVLAQGLMQTNSQGRFEAERPLTGKSAVEAAASIGRLMKRSNQRSVPKIP